MTYIFDLDQTIVDSSVAEKYREQREWGTVRTLIPKFKLYDGIDEIFKLLHERGERICVVTSSPESYCKSVLRHFNINVDCTVCYHDTKKHKPNPEPIIKAIELLGETPSNIISVGDAESDIIASKRAGVVSCLANWGRTQSNIDTIADYVFDSVKDLKNYIIA